MCLPNLVFPLVFLSSSFARTEEENFHSNIKGESKYANDFESKYANDFRVNDRNASRYFDLSVYFVRLRSFGIFDSPFITVSMQEESFSNRRMVSSIGSWGMTPPSGKSARRIVRGAGS